MRIVITLLVAVIIVFAPLPTVFGQLEEDEWEEEYPLEDERPVPYEGLKRLEKGGSLKAPQTRLKAARTFSEAKIVRNKLMLKSKTGNYVRAPDGIYIDAKGAKISVKNGVIARSEVKQSGRLMLKTMR